MSSFAIQRGASVLCRWDMNTGRPTFHDRATHRDGLLVIDEIQKFALGMYDPEENVEYRVTIGDVPLADLVSTNDDVGGVYLGDRIIWREFPYFESARGLTTVVLEKQPTDAEPEQWATELTVNVIVLPSKIGEDRYQCMVEDLQSLSRNLIIDLYGKSHHTRDLRLAKEGNVFRSGDEELHSIERVLDQLGPLLHSISQRPASRIVSTTVTRPYRGGTRLTTVSLACMARRGQSPMSANRPLSVRSTERRESFDVPEHRVVQGFLEILRRRATYCAQTAHQHIRSIQADRHLRDIRLGDRQSIYETVDLPRIKRLENAALRATQALVLIDSLQKLSFLRSVPPELVAVHEGTFFQRNPDYQFLLYLIRRHLLSNALWYEGDETSDVTKLTSRLFEQWCYLRIVEAFRGNGLVLREWDDALRQSLKSRFILDFDRGLVFEGELGSELRVRFRFEPWVLSRESALKFGETLCRGSTGDVAWCPDVLIECLRRDAGEWRPVYGVVLDCKYTSAIKDDHWKDTVKYLEIRDTTTQRQVVKQLWLIAPTGRIGIHTEDSVVKFTEHGPSCRPDEAVRFVLHAAPGSGSEPFHELARGILAYFRRHFSALHE